MNVYINKVSGIDDALVALTMSKRHWTLDRETDIRDLVCECTYYNGAVSTGAFRYDELAKKLDTLTRIGAEHITLLRFIDFSITVDGLHRGGQDDWDSHAKRFSNRIVRESTRLASFENEKSDYYNGKILTTDEALEIMGVRVPNTVTDENGNVFVKATNGYIREDVAEDQDVKRGLYMLSIPSRFIFKIDLTEWAHVYKMRNKDTHANPEVQQLCEKISDGIEAMVPQFNRELMLHIKN